MHKVKELENRWFHYKMKQIIMPAIKVTSVYLIVVGAYYMYDKNGDMVLSSNLTSVLGVSMDANDSIDQEKMLIGKTTSEPLKIPKKQDEKIEEKEKIVLSPIIPVIDMEKEERISETVKKHKQAKKNKHVKKTKPSKATHTVKAKKNSYLTAKELAVVAKPHTRIEVVPPRKTKKIHFTSTSSNYIALMKQKFSKSKSPRDALLLAKAYYKKHQYSASEEWALSANKLDNSLEDSWLLFAKSKAKLGKKKEALTILVSYYKKSHSPKATSLIGQIKTGRI
jgi:hypothetical protein